VYEDYVAYVAALRCGAQGKRLRRRAARLFLTAHPDFHVWMARPTPQRLLDIRRTGAWPLLSWCFVHENVRPDVDLLVSKRHGHHFKVWADTHHDQTARARQIADQLGWGDAWTHRVCEVTLALVCLTQQVGLDQLTDEILDRFEAQLLEAPSIGAHARMVHRNHLYGVRQVAFQLGIIDQVPLQAYQRVTTNDDRASDIPQPQMRELAVRYLDVVATTLRPATVDGRADSLTVFALWLADTHPEVHRFGQVTRGHIEDFMVFNRTRPSRARAGRGEPISLAHAAHTLSDLKMFFDDLTLWGWAEAPERLLVHRTDIPRRPQPLPRALPPDVDRALMAAVTELEDMFARCAITILRHTGLRLGELRDLETRLPVGHPRTRHLAEGAARQAGHRTARPPRRDRSERVRHLDLPPRPPEGPTPPARRSAHRLRVHRRRTAAVRPTHPPRPPRRCRRGGPGRDRRDTAHSHPAPAASHLRDQPRQRRDVPPSSDGAAGTRHLRDDPALRHPC
jgi:hypothetical protein